MNQHRANIFTGKLYMPTIEKIQTIYGKRIYSEIEKMFEAMWFNYLKEGTKGTVSLPYWAKRIGSPRAMNIALMKLSKGGWIISKSIPSNNWGEAQLNEKKLLEFADEEELASVRKSYKFSKYILRDEDEAVRSNYTRLNGKVMDTGIKREGFMKTSNTKFKFDTNTMEFYKDEVTKLINKGITKMIINYPSIAEDLANYENVGKEIVEDYIWNEGQYSSGQNQNDSRGRNIAGYLNKIGNPVGFKIMRSLLIIPEAYRNMATAKGLKNKYLFIAELLGYKSGTVIGKMNYGRRAYFDKRLNEIELPKDLDELYENIWLERMYDEIDMVLGTSSWKKKAALVRYKAGTSTMTRTAEKIETFELNHKWYVPVEID